MTRTQKLLVIVGATAVGKTAYGLELAILLKGEVVSADSRYLYRGMDIGTAKPSADQLSLVRHHLIDVTTPDQPWSLADYKRAATRAIDNIQASGRLPLLVGGTGQYVRAIVEGWNIPPRPEDGLIRAELEATAREPGGANALFKRLAVLDPDSAATMDGRNLRRIIRALEVCILTGRAFSAQRGKSAPPYDVFVIGLSMSRERLYERIDARIDFMLRSGWVEEVRRLLKQGYTWKLPAMSALGYRQLGAHLRGEIDLQEARRRIQMASRRLVRRQAGWFGSEDRSIHWYEVGEGSLSVIKGDISGWYAEPFALG